MNSKTILLLYEKDHLKQPFIKLLLKSLKDHCPKARIFMASLSPKEEIKDDHIGIFLSLAKWKKSKAQNPGYVKRVYGAGGFSRRFIKDVHDLSNMHKPDLIITFLPLGFFAAQTWARLYGCRSVYYPFEIYGKQRSKYSWLVVVMEILGFLMKPDAVITQNEHRAKFYVERRYSRIKPVIAHNYKSRPDTSVSTVDFSVNHGIPRDKKVVLYQGMLSEGRWLDRLVEAAKYFRDDAVLVLMGKKQEPWWSENIEPLLKDSSTSGRIIVLESVPHEMVFPYARASRAGVIIYDDSVLNNVYCEPGKLSDFVQAGGPTIAPAFPTIRGVVNEHHLGVVFSDYSSRGIANAVNELLALPPGHFKGSLVAAAEYMTWEAQWPALSRYILGNDFS